MDKDMINIDDLFKDRLNDNEEKERPGAWLLMKDILNEKMPAAVAVGAALYNWRKIYSFFAGAAVIGSVIVGYKAMHKNDGAHKAVNTTAVTYTSAINTIANSSGNQKQKETNTANSEANNIVEVNIKATNTTIVPKSASVSAVKTVNSTSSVKAPAVVGNYTSISNATNNVLNAPKPNANNNSNLLASGKSLNKSSEPKIKQDPVQQLTRGNNQTNNSTNNTNNTSNLPPPIVSNRQNTPEVQPALPRVQDPHKTNPRYIDKDAKMDSAELIVVKESVRKGKVNVTTTHGMIARAKNNLPETEENFYSHPAEPATSSSVDEAALVNMKGNKVESKYYKSRGSSNFFEEMVKNVSVDMSGISFHGGLMGGINSSLGIYHMAGFQAGLVGMMDINDRWMVFAELKYQQRFGNGKSLYNNYNKLATPVYQGGNVTNYQWESVEHYFNISSSSLVELPIAVRYSSKRISVFTGLNTAYNFAVNVEEKENKQLHDYMAPTGTPTSTITSGWDKDQPVITTNDFGARLTMGAMLGFGYQVSPAVGVDLRISQPFWDNVKSKGAYQVSKELYRVPSLQFNLTYRFSNNNYKLR